MRFLARCKIAIAERTGLIDVYAAVIPGVPRSLHVNYSETKLPIRDGLLKLKDFPTDWVGQELKSWNSSVRTRYLIRDKAIR